MGGIVAKELASGLRGIELLCPDSSSLAFIVLLVVPIAFMAPVVEGGLGCG